MRRRPSRTRHDVLVSRGGRRRVVQSRESGRFVVSGSEVHSDIVRHLQVETGLRRRGSGFGGSRAQINRTRKLSSRRGCVVDSAACWSHSRLSQGYQKKENQVKQKRCAAAMCIESRARGCKSSSNRSSKLLQRRAYGGSWRDMEQVGRREARGTVLTSIV